MGAGAGPGALAVLLFIMFCGMSEQGMLQSWPPHAARLPARSVSVPWPGYGAGGGLGPAGHPPALHVGLVWFVR